MRSVAKYISAVVLVILGIGVFSFGLAVVYAQPAYTINYQGKLTDNTGLAVTDGTYVMEFKLYTQSSGGVAIWTETRSGGNVVTVTNGLFSVMLGSVTSISGVNFNQPLYLGVNIAGDGEMTPRKAIGTVPSAFEARQLGGVASTSFLRSDAADSASGLLTFTGGFISSASSSASYFNFTNATGTSIYIGGDRITDFVGTGLSLSGTTLTATLGTDITAAEIANGDHGFFSYSSGVASLDTGGLTSADILGALTDETGTGALVFGTTPTFTTNITSPLIYGGSAVGSSLSLQSTSGAGTSDYIRFLVGNNGATEAGRFSTTGNFGIGSTSPYAKFSVTNTGTAPSFMVEDATSPDTSPFIITSNGTVGIGTSTPSTLLYVTSLSSPQFTISNQNPTTNPDVRVRIQSYQASQGGGDPSFQSFVARGSINSPSPVISGQALLQLQGRGFAEAGFGADQIGAEINFIAERTWANSVLNSYINFKTAGTGSWTTTERMRINASGNIGIGTSTPNQRLSIFRSGSDAAIEFSTVSGPNEKWTVGIDDSDAAKFKISSSSALGTSDRLTIDGNGYVGIGDSTPLSLFTVGSGDLFQINSSGVIASSNNLTPNAIFSTGQADEECLTYESTGSTFEWQSCGAGGGLNSTDIDTSSELAAILTDETGTGQSVFSISPAFSGTPTFAALTATSTLTLSGSAANIALGSNYLSGDGQDEGLSVSAAGRGTFSNALTVTGDIYVTNTADIRRQSSTVYSSSGSTATPDAAVQTVNDTATNGTFSGAYFNSRNSSAIYQAAYLGAVSTAGAVYTPSFVFGIQTGSATYQEYMRISPAGNIGIGTTTPNQKLSIYNGAADAAIEFSSATAGGYKWTAGIDYSDAAKFKISSSSALGTSDRLTIDGNGYVGIGDSTPLSLFTVGSGDLFQINSSGVIASSNNLTPNAIFSTGQADEECLTYESTGSTFEWQSCGAGGGLNSTDIDTSSELAAILTDETGTGRSVFSISPAFSGTPTFAALTATSTLTLSGSAANIALGSNYLSGDGDDEGIYVSSTGSVGIGTTTPNQKLSLFASAADSAIEFSSLTGSRYKWTAGIDYSDGAKFKISSSSALGTNDRLTIDGKGWVGIGGVTASRELLHVQRSSTGFAPVNAQSSFIFERNGDNYMEFISPSSNAAGILFNDGAAAGGITYSHATDKLSFLAGGGTTRMTISNTNGSVSIGTTTTSQRLGIFRNAADAAIEFATVSGAHEKWTVGIDDSDAAKFKISSSSALGTNDRLVIDGNGYVGIGDSTPDSRLDIETDTATNYAAQFFNDGNNANRYGLLVQAGLDDHTAAGPSTLLQFNDGDGGAVGSITFGSSAVAYNTTSDRRLKTNIVDTSLGIDELMAIQVRDYNWLADADKSTLTHGFIAQELYDVFPQAVTVPKEANKFWMVDYSKLTPLIIAGVQEQQVVIEDQAGMLAEFGSSLFDTITDVSNLQAAITTGISENYKTNDETLVAGDIVSLDPNDSVTIKKAVYGEYLFGVVASSPGLTLGISATDTRPVALTGRVPVRVNLEGGDIAIGDAITLSSVEGVGTKATTTTRVIGKALEATNQASTILVFIEPQTYFQAADQTKLGELFIPIANDNTGDSMWSRLTNLATNFVDGVLKVTGIKTDELCVGNVCVDEQTFLEMVEGAGQEPISPVNVPSGDGGGGSDNGGGTDPEPTPEPPPTPEPDPMPEPTPEPPPDGGGAGL